jgi:hypothetical protein
MNLRIIDLYSAEAPNLACLNGSNEPLVPNKGAAFLKESLEPFCCEIIP